MGNSASSGRAHQDESVDFGALTPQGIYTGPRDWNQQVAAQAIVDRRLAPFYRPLEDYEEGWDDEQILAARKEPAEPVDGDGASTRAESTHSSSSRAHHKRAASSGKDANRLNEAALYRGAIECPICFLYYPPNINYSRCCGQAICTECFVQIKRAEPTATHLESEPAACPYCVQSDFGIVYTPPQWRTGIGSDGSTPPTPGASAQPNPNVVRQRRKSFGLNDPEVITIDYIRPDWEAKLAAVRAAVARRANRRIIMRQVGDRLIPVGISSGRVQILPSEGGVGEGTPAEGEGSAQGTPSGGNSRRSRRRERELNRLLGLVGGNAANYPGGVMAAQDLEELMIAEAMRLSLLEEEERQRKEREKKEKEGDKPADDTGAAGSSNNVGTGAPSSSASESPAAAPLPSAPGTSSPAAGVLQLPAVTGSSLLPPPGPGTDERGRAGHRPSSSLHTPHPPLSDTNGTVRARSQPPASVLGAALHSAVSAASAAGAPPSPREGDGAASQGKGKAPDRSPELDAPAIGSAVTTPQASTHPLPNTAPSLPLNIPAHASAPIPAAAEADVPLATPGTPKLSPRPLALHAESFASSIFSVDSAADDREAYDVLASSPESDGGIEMGREPLLADEAPIAR